MDRTDPGYEAGGGRPSVLYVFRTVEEAQGFLASRVRRHVHAYREELTPLVGFLADRGPLPRPEELPNAEEVAARSGASGPRTP